MVYNVKIIDIKKELEDTSTFFLEKPKGFTYVAGQYGIFEHKIAEEIIRRSYSFSSSPTEDHLAITVRYIPNGKMTTYLFGLSKGDILTFNGAFGKFTLENQQKVVLIGGGSGVTPFRAMAKYAIDMNLTTEIVLIYGARSPREILFDKEFQSFLSHTNFKLFLTVDKPDSTWKYHTGFVNADFIKEATKNELFDKTYFLCGPPIMLTSIQEAIMKLGVHEEKIILDAWG